MVKATDKIKQKADEAKEAIKEKIAPEKEETQTNEVATVENDIVAADGKEEEEDLLEFSLEELQELSGMDGMMAHDFRVPFAKLYQKGAKTPNNINVAQGDFLLPDGTIIHGYDEGACVKGLSILKYTTVRVYFPSEYKKENTFICRSRDGIVGAPDGKYNGRKCEGCEFAQYPAEGGSSPCREQKLLLCTLDDGVPFQILVSGIGVPEFQKNFLSVEMTRGQQYVIKKYKTKLMAAMNVTLTFERTDTDNGIFARPVFKVDREQPLHPTSRVNQSLAAYRTYKEFDIEAIDSAATFAQSEQNHGDDIIDAEPAGSGKNEGMF